MCLDRYSHFSERWNERFEPWGDFHKRGIFHGEELKAYHTKILFQESIKSFNAGQFEICFRSVAELEKTLAVVAALQAGRCLELAYCTRSSRLDCGRPQLAALRGLTSGCSETNQERGSVRLLAIGHDKLPIVALHAPRRFQGFYTPVALLRSTAAHKLSSSASAQQVLEPSHEGAIDLIFMLELAHLLELSPFGYPQMLQLPPASVSVSFGKTADKVNQLSRFQGKDYRQLLKCLFGSELFGTSVERTSSRTMRYLPPDCKDEVKPLRKAQVSLNFFHFQSFLPALICDMISCQRVLLGLWWGGSDAAHPINLCRTIKACCIPFRTTVVLPRPPFPHTANNG
nr:hypothetical protein Iba_chr13bCG5120 [Ipomoea batatas]